MLLTNQRLDKLAAARVDFSHRRMLIGSCFSYIFNSLQPIPESPDPDNGPDPDTTDVTMSTNSSAISISMENDDEDVDCEPYDGPTVFNHVVLAKTRGTHIIHIHSLYSHLSNLKSAARSYPHDFDDLGHHINHPNLSALVRRFLYDQMNPDSEVLGSTVDLSECPELYGSASVFNSAVAVFYAPSDLSGIGGMYRERIRATPAWKKGDIEAPRYDCMFIDGGLNSPVMQGLRAVRVLLFFSFCSDSVVYPCALVQWFEIVGNEPDQDVGMWMVKPVYTSNNQRLTSVVHLDCALRGAHLLPVFGDRFVPRNLHYSETLDAFRAFYVNKYIDHHAFEILSEF
jgi:hypothetical protein